jgi:hypothetical protein
LNLDKISRAEQIIYGRIRKLMQHQISERGKAVICLGCVGVRITDIDVAAQMLQSIVPPGFQMKEVKRGTYEIYK